MTDIKTIAADIAQAQQALAEARKALDAAEAAEYEARVRCNAAADAWFAVEAVASAKAEWIAWDEAGNAWSATKEAAIAARNHVAECIVDLATAQRHGEADPTPCPQCQKADGHKVGCELS